MGLAAVYSGVALNATNSIIDYSMNRKYSDNSGHFVVFQLFKIIFQIFIQKGQVQNTLH